MFVKVLQKRKLLTNHNIEGHLANQSRLGFLRWGGAGPETRQRLTRGAAAVESSRKVFLNISAFKHSQVITQIKKLSTWIWAEFPVEHINTNVSRCNETCCCVPVCSHFPASLISIPDPGRHKGVTSIQTCYYSPISLPPPPPPIQSMLWNPWHSLSGWHVFHAWDEQLWPLTRVAGRCLGTWARLTGDALKCFCCVTNQIICLGREGATAS